MFRRTHTKLICDVSELTALIHSASRLEDLLQRITEMIAGHMECEVCSVYLFDDASGQLILKATKGLKPQAIDNVRLKPGEGLTGVAFKEKRTICEGQADKNPNYRFFPEIGEENFNSLLAVPIIRGATDIGVIVVQSVKRDYFTKEDTQVFRAITAQLASTIETARLLLNVKERRDKPKASNLTGLKFIKGKSGAEGVAYGPSVVLDESLTDLTAYYQAGDKQYTEEDFHQAINKTENELNQLQQDIEESLYDVAGLIFSSHIMMLKDQQFIDEVVKSIREGEHAVMAIAKVVEGFASRLAAIQDDYLKERAADIKDVGRRLLENLTGKTLSALSHEGKVVIAKELFPSDALKLYSQKIKGLVLLSGGVTGHLAILARSLNLPLVIVHELGLLSLPPGYPVLVDAVMGYVHLDPDEGTRQQTFTREEVNRDIETLKKYTLEEAKTQDGTAVKLLVNINLLGDLKAAVAFNAQGVGLYRSEFPFMIRNNFPTEEEQVLIYQRLLEGMKGKPVTMRTLDIGGDKLLSYFDYGREENPFLGLRSIRFLLMHPEIFCAQLKAMLRAAKGHNLKILFPMVSSIDEFLQAKTIVHECIAELAKARIPMNDKPQLGIMVELPALIEVIDDVVKEADFLALGTNDLIQYMLAVDRTNDKVASLYVPHHPAVLRAIQKVAKAAQEHKKELCVCGDMARDPRCIPLLLGMGIRSLSMDARFLPNVHQQLKHINLAEARRLVTDVLAQSQITRIQHLINNSCILFGVTE